MNQFAQFALITFTSVLFIVDPIAALPTFLVITQDQTPDERKRTALRACIAMAILLTVFGLAGNLIFHAFGITLPAFRIAGGFILWLVAIDMLKAQRSTQGSREELQEGVEKEDVALTPLAIPVLAGPGAISTVMVLAGQSASLAHSTVLYGAIALTAFLSYVCLRLGDRLVKYLGRSGIGVVTRVMGLLLAAVATQFIVTGVLEAFRS
ncbi:MAG: MarC family protein [Gemmatimonadota bacterium]